MSKKLLIIGTLPETAGIGGVTIHVQRLIKWLNIKKFCADFCDYKKEPFFSQLKTIASHKTIHIHASNPYLRIIYLMLCTFLFKKTIFTVHGDLGRFSKFKNFLDKMSVKLSSVPIVINKSSYGKAIKWNKNTRLMSAFVPPYESGFVPEHSLQLIREAKDIGKKIYATNAYHMSFDKYGNEIYGIDFLISFFKNKTDSVLVISDPSADYKKLYEGQQFANIVFISEPHSFYAVITESDFVLRATSTDGDSLSVKESLYANKVVIATDCVDRPEGVIPFVYNDSASFAIALKESENHSVSSFSENTVDELISLYKELIKD
ncbi:MAG: glycosyltransferase [Muribaculaceae bacterium]